MQIRESSGIIDFMIPYNMDYEQATPFVLPPDQFVIEQQCVFINPLNNMVENFVDFSMKVSRKNISYISNFNNDFMDIKNVALAEDFSKMLQHEGLLSTCLVSASCIEFYTFYVEFHSKHKPIVVQFFSKQKALDCYSAISKFYLSE